MQTDPERFDQGARREDRLVPGEVDPGWLDPGWMSTYPSRFTRAVSEIDEANNDDPVVLTVRGVTGSKERLHAELMVAWVLALDPAADELQLLAARAHHLRRWSLPRASFPDGRAGYLRWRSTLKRQHAEEVAVLLQRCGYADAEIERVQAIVRKEGLGTDPAVQVHEDALCLVFIETQFAALAERLERDHMVRVVRKTLSKMSADGVRRAVALDLDEEARSIIADAST